MLAGTGKVADGAIGWSALDAKTGGVLGANGFVKKDIVARCVPV